MVGDAITDIAVARAAGIAVIAVDFGYSETPVAELAPDRIVSSFGRLPAAVFALLAARKGRNFRRKLMGNSPYGRHT